MSKNTENLSKINIPIFIPSYHRPNNNKTLKWLMMMGYPSELIYVFIDNEADDINAYKQNVVVENEANLVIFDIDDARRRYDYIHRISPARRSVGQARNCFQDYAKEHNIDFYLVIDDDTNNYRFAPFGIRFGELNEHEADFFFKHLMDIQDFIRRRKIGTFALAQTGDFYSTTKSITRRLMLKKVMNTTFYYVPYIYRAERGMQDEDTSLFMCIHNEGLFTGSLCGGIILDQQQSATAKGGLTELYRECKLLNKSLITPIQFPSAIKATYQKPNGGRLHHFANYRYIRPCLIKGKRSNIAWDTYPEDYPFTNEPKRNFDLYR